MNKIGERNYLAANAIIVEVLKKKAAGNDPATLNFLLGLNNEISTLGFPVPVEILQEY